MNDTARIYIQRAADKLKQAYQFALNDITSEDIKVNINEAINEINQAYKIIYDEKQSKIPLESISIEPTKVELKPKETLQLQVSILPANATNKAIKFESFNTGLATVDENGLVTAILEGEVDIVVTALDNENIKSTCRLNIKNIDNENIPETSIYTGILIANEIKEMHVGDILGIVAHVLPYSYANTNKYTLSSSNDSIVKVDNDAKTITGLSKGSVTIKATTDDRVFSDTISFNVVEAVENIITDEEIYTLELDRFNIKAGLDCDIKQAKVNRNGIMEALKFCERAGYKKLVFPTNTYVIDPSYSINPNSNFIMDLNGSTIKIIPNSYKQYTAIDFRSKKGINLLEDNDLLGYTDKVNLLNTDNVYRLDTSKGTLSLTTNFIDVKPLPDIKEYNQYNNFIDRNKLYVFSSKITKNISGSSSVSFYIDYYKDNNLALSEKINNSLWIGSSTAQYFTNCEMTINLNKIIDYNKVKLRYEIWCATGVSGNFYSTQPLLYRKAENEVLENFKLCNGTILGERDEKSNYYSNWNKDASTEGCVSIVFSEGYNNGIENLKVCKSPGFNMSSAIGSDSYNAKRGSLGIDYRKLQFGNLDSNGNEIDDDFLIRYSDYLDIHDRKHINFGYPLGYMGYDVMRARIVDLYFYDKDKKFISRKRGKVSYKEYDVPDNSYYLRLVLHTWGALPTSGNSDFGGAIGFIDSFNPPTKNYIRNCTISDNYSCGFAACGGQNWIIENNVFENNGGRMPGCDIDWEDGWEYMQDDIIRNNTFKSYNTLILCAGNNFVIKDNNIAGHITVYGRTQNYKFVDNNCYKRAEITVNTGMSFSAQTDRYIVRNIFKECNISNSNQHTDVKYVSYFNNNKMSNCSTSLGLVSQTNNNSFYSGNNIQGTLYNSTINGPIKYFLTAASLYNCIFNNTTNLYITNNTLFDNCTFNTATIYAQGISNSGFVTCTIQNSKATDLSLSQTSWSCGINYVIDNCEITNTNKQLLYLRVLGNETNADNTIKNSTLKFIKQSTTTLNPIYLVNNFGTLNIEGNNIVVEGNSYLISGDSITSGNNIINYSNNTLSQGVSILNSKYNNNTIIKLNTV